MIGTLLKRELTGHSGAVGEVGAVGAVGAVGEVGAVGGAVRAVAILKRKLTGHSGAAVGAVGVSISVSSSSAFLTALWGVCVCEGILILRLRRPIFQHNKYFVYERLQ